MSRLLARLGVVDGVLLVLVGVALAAWLFEPPVRTAIACSATLAYATVVLVALHPSRFRRSA